MHRIAAAIASAACAALVATPSGVDATVSRGSELAVKIARETDRAVEQVSDDVLTRNAAAPQSLNVVRATHRREHLDEIEAVLR